MEKISEDKLERFMEKTMYVSQFVMSCIMFHIAFFSPVYHPVDVDMGIVGKTDVVICIL